MISRSTTRSVRSPRIARRPALCRALWRALALALALLALPGCEAGEAELPGVGSGPPTAHFPGMYAVDGITTDEQTGETRRVGGSVIIAGLGDEHTATFNLRTELVTPDGPVKADLIGSGKGRSEGGSLVGTAETQMFLAAIPGLDPQFPWIPGHLGPRIVSSFTMASAEPGAYQLEITTRGVRGAAGQDYGATRTALRAVRTTGPVHSAATQR